MKERKTTINVAIDYAGYEEKITTDNIVTAVDFYNQTMNDIDGVDYNDFPLFKDECSEVDYTNAISDTVAKRILQHFDNPSGVFGGDDLNKICNRYHKMKQERDLYFRLLAITLSGVALLLYAVWEGLC